MNKQHRMTGRVSPRWITALIAIVALAGFSSGALASDDIFFNPYAGIDWTTYGQHKANLHNHTTQSDGTSTPAERIDQYHDRGYEILALTDHNTTTWSWNDYGRDPAALGMVAIQGSEPSRHNHILSYFNEYDGSSSNIDTSFQTIGDNGGLSVIAHPGRYNRDTQWYADHYNNHSHLVGMEVYNQGDRYPGDRVKWDNVLTEMMPDRPVWGFSNDDTHTPGHIGRNTNFFVLPELTEDAARDAMVNGHTYFSYSPQQDGAVPTINAIDVDQSAGTIAIDGDGHSQTRWISDGVPVATGDTLDYAASLSDVARSYVRAELHGPTGITYTQPFGVLAEGPAPPPSPFIELTFEQNEAGYVGTEDKEIRSSGGDVDNGDNASISVDGDDGSPGEQPNQGLIKFADIIGSDPSQLAAGSTVAQATLSLEVHNPGSGMQVYQMTADWDESTTWNDLGGDGVTPGGEAKNSSMYTINNVGTGTLNLNVTDGVQAWLNGEDNYGIGLIPTGTNGIDFRTSESDNPPVLTVRALRPGVTSDTYQQGTDGYNGAFDTLLMQSEPTTSHATEPSMSIDNNDPHGSNQENHGLIRFNDLFGDQPGQVPTDDTTEILLAELVLEGFNPGSGASLHRMLVDWSDDATWDGNFGGDGIQADGMESVAFPDATTSGDTGTVTIDVTASLRAWLDDPSSNFGWALLPTGGNGWDFDTSEGSIAPTLRVYHIPEPSSLLLLGLGGLALARRRRA